MGAEKNNGGAAFPRPSVADVRGPRISGEGAFVESGQPGMTLRDYFAAKAMQGIVTATLSNPKSASVLDEERKKHGLSAVDAYATAAYQIADAMLAEREK